MQGERLRLSLSIYKAFRDEKFPEGLGLWLTLTLRLGLKRDGTAGLLRYRSTPGLLPDSSNESQLCWASNEEKWGRTRDTIKDEKRAGSEIRTQREEVRTTQSSGTGALGWKLV